ncbi:MAG: twin-arginine translocation signal domain-containing protein [Pirellulales bacterium]|nr:twin-arginine translocation signal domain-containing protein [Pirellulales bacterium]
MAGQSSRRDFLQATAWGSALAGAGQLGFLAQLPKVSAAEARLAAAKVQFDTGIEPLVQLLEETPRERLLEEVGARVRGGLSYRDLLAALLLAGVRNVQPRPHVGFKFHAVLVVNSAHLASLASPDEHRWLPIFWALDHFKEAQSDDVREGDWTMGAVDEGRVPPASKARAALVEALDKWDVEAADAAIAGLARSAGADEIYELLFRYGARDFRDIGHKAIYVANSRRTLDSIGWQHAEPVLRSLVYALLCHDGTNPATADLEPDRPWRENEARAAALRGQWLDGQPDDAATRELLATLRTASAGEACDQAVALLNRGVAAQSIWDALFAGAGELLVRQTGIVALHAVTSTNALHYAYAASDNDDTRRRLLLQNVAFLPLFRQAMGSRGSVKEWPIESFEPLAVTASGGEAIGEVFAELSRDRQAAASKALAYLQSDAPAAALIDAARLLIFLKGNNSHDYKFSSAVLEDYYHVSPAWRDQYLAANVVQLRGSRGPDNRLVERIRAALSGSVPA